MLVNWSIRLLILLDKKSVFKIENALFRFIKISLELIWFKTLHFWNFFETHIK
jgi:hypothetical protein